MIKLNGLGHVGGCGCGSCSGCSVPSQLRGLGGPAPYPAPLTSTPVTHLSYGQFRQANPHSPITQSPDSPWFKDLPDGLQPPPDYWRNASGGPSPGMDSRTQQQQAWEQGTQVKQTYTDVLNGNMDKVGALAAQSRALDRAARETDPLARARAYEDARAYGDEAARLAAGGAMRPGVPVKRTVQWEEVSSGGYAEIQQREMERRGVKTYRPPGWQPNLETERLRAEKARRDAELAARLAKQKADQAARRAEQDRINRERQAALKARADAEKARQAQAKAEREAAERAARAAQREAAEREARARKVLEDAEKNSVKVAWAVQPPRVQQAQQARQATPAKPGVAAGVARWGKAAYGLMGDTPVSALFQGPGRGEPVAAQIGRQGATVGGLMALVGLYFVWRYGQ